MTPSAKLYFEKYNVRQLIKPNITRDEFNKRWAKQLEMLKANAEKEFTPATTQEEKEQTFRLIEKVFFASMGRRYSYFNKTRVRMGKNKETKESGKGHDRVLEARAGRDKYSS